MGERWLVCGQASSELAAHLAWDLLELPPPQVRALVVQQLAVVLPYSRQPQREVHLDRCAADGVPVVRRPSGGGAVLLAPGMVTLSALAPLTGNRSVERLFARFCGWLADGLAACGVEGLGMQGVSDLCLGDRKVVGTALRLLQNRVLFQASVLVDASLELIERYLPYPSRAPAYRGGRSHSQFLTTLVAAGYALSCGQVAEAVAARFARALASGGGSS